jgi:hypothetical protein
MKLVFQLFCILLSTHVWSQNYVCPGQPLDIENGMQIQITWQEDGTTRYLGGNTCNQQIDLRNASDGPDNITWELHEYDNTPSVYRFKSLGGCEFKWLDGITISGNLILRNTFYPNGGFSGTRWKIYQLGENKYAFENKASSTSNLRWLCYREGRLVLLDDYKDFGSNWNIVIR